MCPDTPDAQPREFPVAFEEWAAALRAGPYRTVLAGYQYRVRAAGQLRTQRPRADWQRDFDAFMRAAPSQKGRAR